VARDAGRGGHVFAGQLGGFGGRFSHLLLRGRVGFAGRRAGGRCRFSGRFLGCLGERLAGLGTGGVGLGAIAVERCFRGPHRRPRRLLQCLGERVDFPGGAGLLRVGPFACRFAKFRRPARRLPAPD